MAIPAYVDLCLAPDGNCICAAKLEQHGTLSTPGSTSDPCWRVRVPWWSQSSVLLPSNLHEQLLRQREVTGPVQVLDQPHTEARVRTPSPPSPRCTLGECQPPPPLLRFAPPQFFDFASTFAYNVASVSDVVRRRSKPCGRGAVDVESCGSDGTLEGISSQDSAMDWETSTSSHRGRRSGTSFVATNLAYLGSKDHACVLAVKKITKLGFEAARSLRLHFEQWGPVEEVLLSNMPIHGELAEHVSGVRRRPPGMGWVVMKNADDVRRALAHGEIHTVQSAPIHVAPFIKKFQNQSSEAIAEEGVEEDVVPDAVAIFGSLD